MNKNLQFNIEEMAKFFITTERTENEDYLLNIILQLGKDYNKLIDKYNNLVYENEFLNRKLASKSNTTSLYTLSHFNSKI
jgi:hypothetical protein